MNLPRLPFKLPPLRMPASVARLSDRERKLLILVAGAIFIVFNLLVVRGLLRSISDLRAQWSNRSMTATAATAPRFAISHLEQARRLAAGKAACH